MESKKKLNRIGRIMTYLLRHNPKQGQLDMSNQGWVPVSQLKKSLKINQDDLDYIVSNDNNGRFSFYSNRGMVRANQGHSLPFVKIKYDKFLPTGPLYHGTATKNISPILRGGIEKLNRTHVHLSHDRETATTVGSRHGAPLTLKIDAVQMHKDGVEIFISENNVVLTEYVDPKYIVL